MATYTPNLNLGKPDSTDPFGNFRQLFNDNMDKIDQSGGGGSSTLAGLSDVSITTPVTNDALIYDGAEWANSPLSAVAFSGAYSDLSGLPTIPTKTSDLNNDSNFVSDASYVHTDNNFTNAYVTKLSGIQAGAEVNVQSDWNEANNTADDFIKNKPTIPTKTSDLNNDSGFLDSSDITVTRMQTTGTKIATIDVDGNSTDLYAPTGGGGDTVVYQQTVISGTELGTLYINGSGKKIYAPTYSLRNTTMGGVPYLEFGSYDTGSLTLVPTRDFSSLVSLANQRASGDKVADLTIDGTTTTLYSKPYTGGEGVDIDASGNVSLEYFSVVNGAVNITFDNGN